MATLAELPKPLHTLAARAPESPERQVQITQRGQMWLKPGARALSFTAVQHLAVDRVAFSWKARFSLLGPLGLRVVDDYDAGAGAFVDVAATVAGERLTVTLELDGRGNVVRTGSTMRRLKRNGEWRATPRGRGVPRLRTDRAALPADRRRGLLGAGRRPLRLLARQRHGRCARRRSIPPVTMTDA
jgi:hypothetical protein